MHFLIVIGLLILVCPRPTSGASTRLLLQMKSNNVLIVGLNPALQRRVSFESLQKGNVNRASSVGVGIGGKGQNVVVASTYMNLKPIANVDVSQFIGEGGEGDSLMSLLREIRTRESLTVRSKQGLRICTTLIDASCGNETTELVEPSGIISEGEAATMLQKVKDLYGGDSARGIAVMGSMPPGLEKHYYGSILDIAAAEGTKVLLDTNVRIPETLSSMVSRGVDAMVKVNARELTAMMDVTKGVGTGGEAESATSLEAVKIASEKLASTVGKAGSFYIGVHDGPHTSYLIATAEGRVTEVHSYTIPNLPRPIVNAIGAGDSVAAGTLLKWTDSLTSSTGECPAVDAFRWGLAVGSASCMTSENSVFSLEDAKALYDDIVVERRS